MRLASICIYWYDGNETGKYLHILVSRSNMTGKSIPTRTVENERCLYIYIHQYQENETCMYNSIIFTDLFIETYGRVKRGDRRCITNLAAIRLRFE